MSQMLRKDAARIIPASLKAVLPDEAVQRDTSPHSTGRLSPQKVPPRKG